MASHEEVKTAQPMVDDLGTPRGELSSKFLRKTKFHRPPIASGDPETSENTSAAVNTDNSSSEPPNSINRTKHLLNASVESFVKDNPAVSTALSSLKLMNSSAHSPQISHATSPPVTDDNTSISSSPRSDFTPDPVIKPPAEATPDLSFPFSPEDLDQAKSLVLDLLGWGVDPEYLITSGVSPVAIFRIFNDLNLQLPTNLEVSEDLKALAYSWAPPSDFSELAE
ncbi:hypothetical protein GALMADRAFT_225142 [Galerina marginata CBS 339.88]|uniref:Uncharacterized protein n=1 Tax=Galerina marginata (strain CBS 339.88) TaxID=685588 RepID=A0A067T3V9_GALM3|nr:hypothetical protein GALMADRAFT_225142 [Galerina marginata CBS 339.88]